MAKKIKNSKKIDLQKIGHYAFVLGLVLAIVAAAIPWFRNETAGRITATVMFVVLGIIVGLLNIKAKETTEFLVATLVLLLSFVTTQNVLRLIPGNIGTYLTIGDFLAEVWGLGIVFIAFAAIVVAIKSVFVLAEK